MNWFQEQRLIFISESLRVYRYINRAHIVRKFGVSTPQASMDLQIYQKMNPKLIEYDKVSKCYRRVVDILQPVRIIQ